jgi:hypothetical protein
MNEYLGKQGTPDFQFSTPGPSRAAASDANLTGRYWGDFDAIPKIAGFGVMCPSFTQRTAQCKAKRLRQKNGCHGFPA